MTLESTRQVKCACGNMVSVKLYDSVNVSADPRLNEKIIHGEINSATCDKCGKPVNVDKYFLYHDEGKNTMIFVYPETDRPRKQEIETEVANTLRESAQNIEAKFGKFISPEKKKELNDTKTAIVFGQDELRKLLVKEA